MSFVLCAACPGDSVGSPIEIGGLLARPVAPQFGRAGFLPTLRERYPEVGDLLRPVYYVAPVAAEDVALDEWAVIPDKEDEPVVLRPPASFSDAFRDVLDALSGRSASGQVVVFCEWNGSLTSPDSPCQGRTEPIGKEKLVRALVAGSFEVDVVYLVRGPASFADTDPTQQQGAGLSRRPDP